jgi:hypothetical protein
MADEKQMNAVKYFCAKDRSLHGKKRTASKGRFDHDWTDLVDQVHFFDFEKKSDDEELLQAVARRVRKAYPDSPDWNERVNKPGEHEKILLMIREGLAEELAKRNPQLGND